MHRSHCSDRAFRTRVAGSSSASSSTISPTSATIGRHGGELGGHAAFGTLMCCRDGTAAATCNALTTCARCRAAPAAAGIASSREASGCWSADGRRHIQLGSLRVAGSGQIAPAWVPIPPRSQQDMHWSRRGARDLFRLPFVCHGHRAEASSNQADEFSPQILDHESGQLVSPSNYSLDKSAPGPSFRDGLSLKESPERAARRQCGRLRGADRAATSSTASQVVVPFGRR